MSATIKLGNDLKSLYKDLATYELNLNTSRDLMNSFANLANNATSKGSYDNYVKLYDNQKTNFDNLLADYEDIGGQYNTTLDKYNTLSFSNQSEVITYEIPNAKDQMQWLAGGTFYNEKNPGGYLWSATNPLSSDEKPTNDLGLVINRGSIHPYLNEGFTEIQNTIRGFGFLDLLGDYTESKTTTYEVTVTVTSSDGSISIDTKYVDGGEGSELASYSIGQSNMGVDAIASMLSSPHMDLMSLNAIGVVQFTITNTLNGKLFSSGKIELGNIIGASLYNTAKNVFSQQLTMGIVNALGITNVYAAGLLSFGVGALVSEFMEYASGMDNHFGFGGDYIGKGFDGNSLYADKQGIADGLSDFFGGLVGMDTQFDFEKSLYSSDLARFGHLLDVGIENTQINNNMPTDTEIAYSNYTSTVQDMFSLSDYQMNLMGYEGFESSYNDFGGANGNNAGGWGDGGSNNSDGMGNNSNGPSDDGIGGYGDGDGGFGGI